MSKKVNDLRPFITDLTNRVVMLGNTILNKFEGIGYLDFVNILKSSFYTKAQVDSRVASSFAGTVDSLTFDPGTPVSNLIFRANAGAGTYSHFLSASSTPISVNTNDGQVDLIYNTVTGFWTKVKATFDFTDYIRTSQLAIAQGSKIDKVVGNNLLNPATFRYGFAFYSGQSPDIANLGNNFGCTDYIPADASGLITSGAGLTSSGLSSYVVYDTNKVWLRNGQDTDHYVYQSGDGFVVYVYTGIGGNTNFAKGKAVLKGTVYTFEDYTDFKPVSDLQKQVKVLQDSGTNISAIQNGTPFYYGTVSNIIGYSARDVAANYVDYTHTGAGNSWLETPPFIPTGSNLIHIKFSVHFTKVGTTAGINIYLVGDPANPSTWYTLPPFTTDGDYEITFDPAFYSVYHGFTNFTIWLANQGISNGQSITARYTNLQVFEKQNSVAAANISGDNAKQLFESADSNITALKASLTKGTQVVSPGGNKFELAVADNGSISAAPVIPAKGLFFGNSLLGGFGGFGMAASAADKDYYHLINAYITTLNSSYTALGGDNNGFENIEDLSTADSVIAGMMNSLVGDESLVVVQLGDNVNNPARIAAFSTTSVKLLKAIRTKCTHARVAWIGMWFGTSEKYDMVTNACLKTGCKFISFSDLLGDASNSAIGNITNRGNATRTLAGVTNVVANTSTNITVTFTVDSVVYHSTLDVTSYSLSAGTLTYLGNYEIISIGGVAAHPGDLGMKKIANKFLYQMGLTDEIAHY